MDPMLWVGSALAALVLLVMLFKRRDWGGGDGGDGGGDGGGD